MRIRQLTATGTTEGDRSGEEGIAAPGDPVALPDPVQGGAP
jgi:hypothetical protein